ncbi:hypothetical protein FHR72_001075 [Mycolicibacterium iranicum]|uniref:Uncharacterized protein n=1 Tax=Mycolicibacterium iranicum TaxID=912594 RepID=A0A839Q8Q7_MYCIR|nr:DUF5994 family protein [Mycolicibacterium iranicum]MBB2989612.1 hypothetical protein [Mycolicibacterium iranicum]
MGASRRASSPIRLTLAEELGGAIDGAWWPHTSLIAAELPDLVGALHKPLGEIVDIRINWKATDGQLVLEGISGSGSKSADVGFRRPRLMVVAGAHACAKLLVVPCMTSQALGAIVVRAAAGLPTWGGNGDHQLYETAQTVLGIAKAESAKWCDTAVS